MGSMAMDDVMQTGKSTPARDLHLLSQLLLGEPFADGSRALALGHELRMLSNWDHDELSRFLAFADLHHVVVRAIEALQSSTLGAMSPRVSSQCATALATEQERISRALSVLHTVCNALESAGCSAIVIKSLDHWPDIGSDLDLYTGGGQDQVVSILRKNLAAEVLPRSWGDRLANKWNFRLPGLPEAVEVHVGCLGQTGEHLNLARRVESRAVRYAQNVGGSGDLSVTGRAENRGKRNSQLMRWEATPVGLGKRSPAGSCTWTISFLTAYSTNSAME